MAQHEIINTLVKMFDNFKLGLDSKLETFMESLDSKLETFMESLDNGLETLESLDNKLEAVIKSTEKIEGKLERIEGKLERIEGMVSRKMDNESALVVDVRKYFEAMENASEPEQKIFREYKYKLLEVRATIPMIVGHNMSNNTKILIRPCYETLYDKICTSISGGAGRIVVAGPPGIGKSRAFGAGFLMYKLLHDKYFTSDFNKGGIKHIVWTSTQGVSVVYNVTTKEVDVYTSQLNSYPQEALLKDTIWLMDNAEHGHFDSAKGTIILFASGKENNYRQMQKTNCKVLWLPAWDGRYDVDATFLYDESEPLPNEFLALCIECFGLPENLDDERYHEIIRKFQLLGPFPRDIFDLGEVNARSRQEAAIAEAMTADWTLYMKNGTIPTLADGPSMRLIYPLVDRKKLQLVPGKTSIASPYVEECLTRGTKKQQYWEVLKKIIGQSQLSGGLNWNLGKAFEELTIKQLTLTDTSGIVKRRFLSEGKQATKEDSLELAAAKTKVFRVKNFSENGGKLDCLYYSRSKTEAAVDAYIVKQVADKLKVYLLQITLNTDHGINWKKLATLIRRIQTDFKHMGILEFEFVFVTSANRVNLFGSARKFTVNVKETPKRKQKNGKTATNFPAKEKQAASSTANMPTNIVSKHNASLFRKVGLRQSVAYLLDSDIIKLLPTEDAHAIAISIEDPASATGQKKLSAGSATDRT